MADSHREALLTWCAAHLPVRVRELTPLAVEASARRFWRVHSDECPTTWIAMHSPPESENNPQFVTLSHVFRKKGVPVPEVHAFDAEQGYLLVEDFGSRLFLDEYPGRDPSSLIMLAMKALVKIQRVKSAKIPPYEPERFHMELGIFREWTCKAMLQIAPTPLDDIEKFMVDLIVSQPRCTVHRDFHSRNLLLRPGQPSGSGEEASIGIVDFQDALVGPCTYDLASFAYDCYWEFTRLEVTACVTEAWLSLPQPLLRQIDTVLEFHDMTELVAVQRMLKAVGIFSRLSLNHRRNSHMGYVIPVLQRAGSIAVRHPELSDLGQWLLDRVVPAAQSRLE